MSFLVRCDACGRRSLCGWNGGVVIPATWRSFELENYMAHACSEKCLETIKTTTTEEPTPTSSTGYRLP